MRKLQSGEDLFGEFLVVKQARSLVPWSKLWIIYPYDLYLMTVTWWLREFSMTERWPRAIWSHTHNLFYRIYRITHIYIYTYRYKYLYRLYIYICIIYTMYYSHFITVKRCPWPCQPFFFRFWRSRPPWIFSKSSARAGYVPVASRRRSSSGGMRCSARRSPTWNTNPSAPRKMGTNHTWWDLVVHPHES